MIAGHTSNLFATLDAQMPRAVWESQLLRAVQTWSSVTNISVGITTDSKLPFGTPGLGEGDSRFGDIRIGGQQMDQSVLSISVPHDPLLSGTWSGDILFNSSFNFTKLQTDFYSIALHELGHVFGLPHSSDPNSVMFNHGAHTYSGLSGSDLASIRAIYGVRIPDINEGSNGNDTLGNATRIRTENPTIPGLAFGDLTTTQDVDYYRIDTPIGYTGSTTFRVQSAGISLLSMRMSLLDGNGNLIDTVSSTDPRGGTLGISLQSIAPGQRYYLRVEHAGSDVFTIGRYGVAVTFNSLNHIPGAKIDSVLRGPFDGLESSEFEKLFETPDQNPHLNDDGGTDDDAGDANRLTPSQGGASVTHFGTLASLASATDVDYYRLRADLNGNQANVLTATVVGLLGTTTAPRIALFDGEGLPIPFQVLVNGNGTYTVQTTGMVDHGDYYLRVSANPAAPASGNYGLTVDIGGQAATLQTFASGRFTGSATSAQQTLYVARPQLFQFLLSSTTTGASLGMPIVATIVSETGATVMTLYGQAGETISGPSVLLSPGEYTIRYAVKHAPGAPPISFSLRGLALSDPIGPVRTDTTLTPRYADPNNPNGYLYPNGFATLEEYLWTTLLFT
jgi:hypothetical protein